MRPLSLHLSSGICALFAASCISPEPSTLGNTEQLMRSANGVSLNGVSLNGVSLNGVSLNGVSLNGVSLNGVSLNGVSLNGVSLNGSELTSSSSTLSFFSPFMMYSNSGASLLGATFKGLLSNGSTLTLRLDAYRVATDFVSSVSFYKVSYQTTTGWSLLCPTGTNEAIALAGRWDYSAGTPTGGDWINDPTAITFACTATALGKCANLGYRPWVTYAGTQLRPFHQACTRMLRADYCGNGTSYTVDGTVINVYDPKSIQTDTEFFPFEAEWTEDGPSCVNDDHVVRMGTDFPACAQAKVSATCGSARSGWQLGVRLKSEVE